MVYISMPVFIHMHAKSKHCVVSEVQIYTYAFNGRWARETMGGWTQIRLSILKFLDFKIRLLYVNGESTTQQSITM